MKVKGTMEPNKKDAMIIFRDGDMFLTRIKDDQEPTTLGQRMHLGGYVVCSDERWDKKRTLVINLSDVRCIVIDE